MRRLAGVALLLLSGGGCLLFGGNTTIYRYEVAPQEFTTPDFGTPSGNVPTVDCLQGGDALCATLPVPPRMTPFCEGATHTCAIKRDLQLVQRVNLSTQKDFPSQVASSSLIQSVEVSNVYYWTPTNTLDFATPPIDLYVGSQTVQTETDAGATLLGTFPPLPAATVTNCTSNGGAPGSQGTDCKMPLTDAGKTALGALAKDYKTPFNVVVVAHLVFHAGDPMPAGQLDMFVQPELGFVIP